MNRQRFATLASILGLVAILALLLTTALGLQGQSTPSSLASSANAQSLLASPMHLLSSSHSASHPLVALPFVQGAQILDGSGNPLTLRGAQIQSPFNNIAGWQRGTPVSQYLNPNVFRAMVQQYHMNELRLPISNWIYNLNPTSYLSKLDLVIAQANSAGLYVVLDLHDNAQSGSPYGATVPLPKQEDLVFWQAIAAHYKSNPSLMFDLFNEPAALKDWATWLNGGGTLDGAHLVGFQSLVNAVRAVGAKQILIVEAGQAGDGGVSTKGWATIGSDTINDPNIMYSLHEYKNVTLTAQEQDAMWGPILNQHPIYYGEWAVLPNGVGLGSQAHCQGMTPANADQITNAFLTYMTSRHANWNAWSFVPYYLIQNVTTFAPTTLDIPWVCGDGTSHAGMGSIIQQFLTTGK